MTTWQIDPLQDSRWAAFVQNHPRASVFHMREWLAALRRTYGYEPVVITTTPPGEMLHDGLVFCRITSWLTGSRSISLPFSDHCEPLVDGSDVLEGILAGARTDLHSSGSRYLELRPALSGDISTALVPAGSYCLHQLQLGPSLDDLFRGFHKDCIHRKILRAERERLSYHEGPELLNHFYHLMVQTRRRQGLPPQPRSWFLNLIRSMGDKLKIRVALKGEHPVAAILTLRCRHTMVYKYGCSDETARNLGGMQLVLWKAIQDAKRAGLALFDFGRSDWDNLGLIVFKDRWGAIRSRITHLRLSRSTHSPTRWVSTAAHWKPQIAKPLVKCLPDGLLCAAGTLLYRHIG